jgi:hypothetical protein
MRLLHMVAISVIALVIPPGDTAADTVHVPGEYATIQDGIDAASPGDTVLVADGVYSGPGNRDISFDGKDLTVRSVSGPAHTVVDLCWASYGFHFVQGETEEAVLRGFTITRAQGMDPAAGAAIRCMGSSPTIMDCLIVGNRSHGEITGQGGGIVASGASPTIIGCTVTRNIAFVAGGGLYAHGSSVTLIESIFWGNYDGDIILADEASSAIIVCCAVDPDGIGGDGQITYEGESVFSDPLFCDAEPWPDPADPEDYKLWSDSPCLPGVSPCGKLIGALPIGCPPASLPDRGALEWSTRGRVMLGLPSPNPTTGNIQSTMILPHEEAIEVSLLDVRGRLCKTLLTGLYPAGETGFSWSAVADGRRAPASGIYYLRLWTPHGVSTRTLSVVR